MSSLLSSYSASPAASGRLSVTRAKVASPATSAGIPYEVRQWAAGVARATSRRHGVEHHAMLTSSNADLPTLVARKAFVRALVANGWEPTVIERHFGMPPGAAVVKASAKPAIAPAPTRGLASISLPGLTGVPRTFAAEVHYGAPESTVVIGLEDVCRLDHVLEPRPRMVVAAPFVHLSSVVEPSAAPRRGQPKCKHWRAGHRCRHDAVEDGYCVAHALQHRPPPLRCPALRPHGKACGHMTVRDGLCALHAQRKEHGIEVRIGGDA